MVISKKKSTGTSSKMETGLTTRKPDYLLPGFTPSVSLNIHVNSFVTIPIHLVRVVSSSAAILEVNRLKLLHRSAIFKMYDVILANEMNGQYFFLMNVYLLKVLQNFQLRHCSCIIILIPRVLFNHVNLQHDDKVVTRKKKIRKTKWNIYIQTNTNFNKAFKIFFSIDVVNGTMYGTNNICNLHV